MADEKKQDQQQQDDKKPSKKSGGKRRRNRSRKSSKDLDWAKEYYDLFEKKFSDKDSSSRIYSKKNKRKDVRSKQPRSVKGGQDLLKGVVLEVKPDGCVVAINNQQYHCVVRGSLKKAEAVEKNIIAVGDRVQVRGQNHWKGTVEHIEPRRSKLSRPYSRNNNIEQVIVANVDQVVIVVSVKEPELKTGLIDRYLIFAEKNDLKPIICVNKIDLALDNDYIAQTAFYRQIGYEVIYTSTLVGSTVEDLKKALKGKISVLAGQSGSGKSSLINAIDSRFNQRVGEISDATAKGRHTTISARLLKLPFGGFIADTPGIREFGLWDVNKEDVKEYYLEFKPYRLRCKMSNCSHTHEPDCAIKEAVEDLSISSERYDNYLRILNSIESRN